MKTYQECARYFEAEIQRLGAAQWALSFREIQRLFLVRSDAADDACRVFLATAQWPPLTDALRLEICCRLACAVEHCGEMAEAPLDPEETGRALIESVLIDYWRDVGQWNWFETEWIEPLRIQNWGT